MNYAWFMYFFIFFVQKSFLTTIFFLFAEINLITRGPLYTCLVLLERGWGVWKFPLTSSSTRNVFIGRKSLDWASIFVYFLTLFIFPHIGGGVRIRTAEFSPFYWQKSEILYIFWLMLELGIGEPPFIEVFYFHQSIQPWFIWRDPM